MPGLAPHVARLSRKEPGLPTGAQLHASCSIHCQRSGEASRVDAHTQAGWLPLEHGTLMEAPESSSS